MLTLRPVLESDLPYLLALRRQTMDEHLASSGLPADDAAHLARIRYHWEDARIVLLDGAPAGLLKSYRGPSAWHVVQVQVAPDHQGQGLGARLLRGVLEQADAAGLPAQLDVLKTNPARRLYERLGFRVVAESGAEFHMERPAGGDAGQ
ncbi:GNAT family N-acetyltransferase [Bordetella petrii]|uniref:Probable acetyltransferase n=1 Tax=Bordetella petrii (strain ATCC BAA-461 / DSM 12804 / CCUG 43448 / CIP 107267 / Se-1111R) TaxID=340100 RepID=A9ISB6_BORPD|nr:GNAT family N-acetyltransferase [Bordetella petrii]CAP43281.1 probable acetyltransferase [Bordetella petrii]